ncbi:replication-associated recombination protein A [Turicibacter bilis]|uniref:Replication-associated recombination protein A n=1 Tax=Turicibacter bilis TaxID=2735723 RepID=A0A9Q9CJY7_9FIRM|nr:replication-associated recombination protein A [Turicibacter bilis]MBS3198948.1 replication-associated recombination protein A [Turicibacter bilis]UUF08491.1 replication-associated recombination protein A [Turicibacter bilis]
MKPLADLIRPQTFDDVVGQQHLIGEGQILRNLIEVDHIPNLIFYGPSGVGKSTIALLLAKYARGRRKVYKLNATDASTQDIKNLIADLGTLECSNGIFLYLDEIQNFNKKQQQSLLKYIENGQITLISSTTENPYFTIFSAILSRSTILEFKPLTPDEIEEGLKRAIQLVQDEFFIHPLKYDDEAIKYIANICNGDLRRGLNALEIALYPNCRKENFVLSLEVAKSCTVTAGFSYDKFGDQHYDTLSAFQKSIRGSDPDAAVHYLARLIKAGDLNSICRRLLVIASEDIGLAYPQAISLVKSCTDAALQLGFPEARIPLAQATILLANSPKSNSAYLAINEALKDIDSGNVGQIPLHLRDAHYKAAKELNRGVEYKYPHDYPKNYVCQQYLPNQLKNKVYYKAGRNKTEQSFVAYGEYIKQKDS